MKIFEGPDHIDNSEAPWDNLFRDGATVRAYRDRYPVTAGHTLFVPVHNAMHCLMDAYQEAMEYGIGQVKSGVWGGFNIGLNYGEVAGQTVNWPHVHLIPRRQGDVEDPVGGVRNTIPGKGNYRK